MVYVALLRGINVGGKSKVAMPQLKAAFEALGFTQVNTYINSGNVIFCDNKHASAQLVTMIEGAIAKDFGFDVRVIVRDLANIQALDKAVPASWTNDTGRKTDVLFLWNEADGPNIIKQTKVNPATETLKYIHGALVWTVDRQHAGQSRVLKLNATPFYQHMTIRNINTLRRLRQLMEATSS
jgi:uncharacterized protein (DUF1697 family)